MQFTHTSVDCDADVYWLQLDVDTSAVLANPELFELSEATLDKLCFISDNRRVERKNAGD